MRIVAAVGEHDQDLALFQSFKSNGSIVGSGEAGGSGLAVLGPETDIRAVVDLDQFAVLVQHQSCAVAVQGNGAFVLAIIDDHGVVGGSAGNHGCIIVGPLAFHGGKLLAGNGDGLVISGSNIVGVSLATILALAILKAMAVSAGIKVGVGFATIGALAVDEVVAVSAGIKVGVSFAAVGALAVDKVVAISAGISHKLQVQTGNSSAHSSVGVEELTGAAVATVNSGVGSNNGDFALLQGSQSFLCIAVGSTAGIGNAIVVLVKELSAGAVIDTDDLAVLVDHDGNTVAIGKANLTGVVGGVDDECIVANSGQLLINSNLLGSNVHGVVTDVDGQIIGVNRRSNIVGVSFAATGALAFHKIVAASAGIVVGIFSAAVAANAINIAVAVLAGILTFRCRLKSQAQTGNGSADGSVGQQELTGTAFSVVSSGVRRNDGQFAILQGVDCLVQVGLGVALGRVNNTAGVLGIVVLAVGAVIDTDDLAVLVDNDSNAIAVSRQTAIVLGSVDQEHIVADTGQILILRNKVQTDIHLVLADLQGADAFGLDLDLTSELGGQLAVGNAELHGVNASLIDIKVTVADDLDVFQGDIVLQSEGAVVILGNDAGQNSGLQHEGVITQLNQHLVVAGNGGLLVDVGSQSLVGVDPVQTNHIANLVDDVVVHEATAVSVGGGAGIAGLHDDGIAASGDLQLLGKSGGNGHALTVDGDGGSGRAGTGGVLSVDQLAVGAVTAFDHNAVLVQNSGAAVGAGNGQNDFLIGGVVEHATLLGQLGILSQLHIQLVSKVQQNALPLVLAQVVVANFQSDVGQSFQHGNGTGAGDLLVTQGCLVGDLIGAGGLVVEVVVIQNDDASALIGNDTEHQVDLFACVDLHHIRNHHDLQIAHGNLRLSGIGRIIGVTRISRSIGISGLGISRLGVGGLGSAGAGVGGSAIVAGFGTCRQRKGHYKHNSQQHCQKLGCSFHVFPPVKYIV